MLISPFTPLRFTPSKSDGIESPYVQTFSMSDVIMVQVIRTAGESVSAVSLINARTGAKVDAAATESLVMGNGDIVDCHTLQGSRMRAVDGFYYISVGDTESNTFRLTDKSEYLRDTILAQYCYGPARNRLDVVGEHAEKKYYFNFRFPGGFKAGGTSYSIDNEQFVTQLSDIVELYSRESVQNTLTLGGNEGVPVWFGEQLNRLLTCKYVYLDGERYARYEANVPEKEQPLVGTDSFIFTQKLQRINYIEPTKA